MATRDVILDYGEGPDLETARESMQIKRVAGAYNGHFYVASVARPITLTVDPFAKARGLEVGVVYNFHEPSGRRTDREIPAGTGEVLWSQLPLVTVVPPEPGILGDTFISDVIRNPAADTRVAINEIFEPQIAEVNTARDDTFDARDETFTARDETFTARNQAANSAADAAASAALVADIHKYAHTGVAWYEQGATAPDTYAAVNGYGADAGALTGNAGYTRQTTGVPANHAVQSRMRRCVVADDGTQVVYYLDADNSAKIAGKYAGGVQTGWVRVYEGALDPVKPAFGQTSAPSAALRAGVDAWDQLKSYECGARASHNGSLWDSLNDGNVGAEPKSGTTASDLTGTHGQVMVEIPAFYYRMDFDPTAHRHSWEVVFDAARYRPFPDLTVPSSAPDVVTINGREFALHPTFKKAGITRAARYQGAFDVSASDIGNNALGIVRSVADGATQNTTDVANTNFRAKARNRNTGLTDLSGQANDVWSIADYWTLHALQLLLFTEYRSLYSQSVIGQGSVAGSIYNKVSGRTAPMGNGSGNCNASGAQVSQGVTGDAMIWRGIEDLWGTAWKMPDGWNIRNGATSTEHWACGAPSQFAWSTITNYDLVAESMKGIDITQYPTGLKKGSFLATTAGGSGSTYLTDYYYANALTDNSWRVALVGGAANSGGDAGVGALNASNGPGTRSLHCGAALLL